MSLTPPGFSKNARSEEIAPGCGACYFSLMMTDLIAAVKALPIEEQREIADELTEHLENLEADDITPEQAAILDRRLKSIREHPERLIDWEDIKAEIAKKRTRTK
jgi:putative addiction module component (TIGR02574 family)